MINWIAFAPQVHGFYDLRNLRDKAGIEMEMRVMRLMQEWLNRPESELEGSVKETGARCTDRIVDVFNGEPLTRNDVIALMKEKHPGYTKSTIYKALLTAKRTKRLCHKRPLYWVSHK